LPPQALGSPGCNDPLSKMIAGGHKSRSLPLLPSPGPADYRPVKHNRDVPKGSFTQARRWDAHQSIPSGYTPGPGHYGSSTAAQHVYANMPGQPKFSDVPRLASSVAGEHPGPSHYKPEKASSLSPQGSFTRSKRWSPEKDLRPGPSDYRKTQGELGRLWRGARQPAFSTVARSTLVRKCITGPVHPSVAKMGNGNQQALQHSASAPLISTPFSPSGPPSVASMRHAASTPNLMMDGARYHIATTRAELCLGN
jgi:hypothetical protein